MDYLVEGSRELLVSVGGDGPSFSRMDFVLLVLVVCLAWKVVAGMSVDMHVVV